MNGKQMHEFVAQLGVIDCAVNRTMVLVLFLSLVFALLEYRPRSMEMQKRI